MDVPKIDTDKLPEEVRQQDGSVGGAEDGHTPARTIPVTVDGIVTVREVPPLKVNALSVTLATTGDPFHIGREPMRRRLNVRCADPLAGAAAGVRYIVLATSFEQAQAGSGLQLYPGNGVQLLTAEALWVTAVGGTLQLSFLAELDQG